MTSERRQTGYHTEYVDQREWLDKLLSDGLVWHGLRSVDLSRKCRCMADRPAVGCERCLGIGYAFTDYLIKASIWRNANAVEYRTPAGPIGAETVNLISLPDYPIKKHDLVLALDLPLESDTPRQPFRIASLYRVSNAYQVRGKNGRVEYYRAYLEQRELQDYRQ